MSNKIGVDVEVGTSGLENDLKKVSQAAGTAGKSMEDAFSGISTRRIRSQARALKELADEYRRLNDTLGKMEKSGTANGLGFGRSGRGFSQTSFRNSQFGSMAGLFGGALGSLMGGGGGIASTAGSLTGSLAGRGIGMLAGGPIGFAAGMILSKTLGGIGSRLDRGVGTAQNNLIETSVLRHSIGSASNDFKLLSDTIKSTSDNVGGLLDSESIKLFKSVSRASGATNIEKLYNDSLEAGKYSKAMGTDLSATGSFFGTMRSLGISSTEQSSRRIGLIIGEAIGKTGAFAKADEMMSAVSNFATVSTRATLTAQPGAMEGYAGLLSTMGSGSIKDISGIASILAQADSSFRAGGGMGEASWNARLASYQHGYSGRINGMDVQYLNEQGMFGKVGDVFSRDSKYYKFGTGREKARYDSIMADMRNRGTLGQSNLDVYLRNMRRQTGGGYLMASSIANDLHLTASQAISFADAAEKYGGSAGLGNELSKRGLNGLSPDQVVRASSFLNADRKTLNEGADSLLSGLGYNNALTSDQRKKLEDVKKSGSDEALRELVIEFTASRVWEKDQGKATEAAIKGMETTIVRASENMVGVMNEVRDAIVIVGGKSYADYEAMKASYNRDKEIASREAKAVEDSRTDENAPSEDGLWGLTNRYTKSKNAAVRDAISFFKAKGASTRQASGIVANLVEESALRSNAVGDGGKAYGVAQWHPDRQADFKRVMGKDIRQSSLHEQYEFVYQEMKRRGEWDRLMQINGASESGGFISKNYERPYDPYGHKAARRSALAEDYAKKFVPPDDKLPPEHQKQQNNKVLYDPLQIYVNHTYTDPNGNTLDAPWTQPYISKPKLQ